MRRCCRGDTNKPFKICGISSGNCGIRSSYGFRHIESERIRHRNRIGGSECWSAETVGGSVIKISIHSDNHINPFDLPRAIRGDDAATGEILRSAAINLHGLFRLMLGTLTPTEDGVLDKAILDTYALKGLTLQTVDPTKMEPPTMHDLVDVLMTTQGGENMAKVLQKYTEGSYAGIFDRQTNVELNNQMVVFQIRDLEEQLRPIAIYIVLNHLWNIVRAEMKKRFLVIDEAWNLMQFEDSAKFLYGIVKRARKYYLGITTITQDVDDFVNSPFGKPIITNSALQVLLKQSASAIDNLQKLFYLTDGEKEVLLNSGVGQGIFFAGNKHVAIQVIASPEEAAVITTKPEEVLAHQLSVAATAKRAGDAAEGKVAALHPGIGEKAGKSQDEATKAAAMTGAQESKDSKESEDQKAKVPGEQVVVATGPVVADPVAAPAPITDSKDAKESEDQKKN